VADTIGLSIMMSKPTRLQVRKKLMEALGMGEYDIEIMWGENGVQFAKWDTGLRGYGWIKNISGVDLAKDDRVLCYLNLLNRRAGK